MESSPAVGSIPWVLRSPDRRAAFTRRCLAVSLALHVTAAAFSLGFHHADEHFQLLEFASAKLGRTPFADLPWEFGARIRPWFQPAVAYGVAQAMQAVGIDSPFAWAFTLRLLSALLGWGTVVALCCCVFGWVRSAAVQRYSILGLATIWFLPYLHVRFSSESWGGSLFFLGFLPLVLGVQRGRHEIHPASAFACGLAMGFAFEARYQAVLLIVGALCWCLRYARLSRRTWIALCAGGICAFAVGCVLDRWGYGAWVMAPLNYVRANLVEDVAAAQFGTDPFWRYAFWLALLWPPPLGVLFVLALATMWVSKPRLSLTWCTLPFVVVHSAIAHKEARFLFPIFAALPAILAIAWQAIEAKLPAGRRYPVAVKAAGLYMAVVNIVLLAIVLFVPARSLITVQAQVYVRGVKELYWTDYDPYTLRPLRLNFYRPASLDVVAVQSSEQFERVLTSKAHPVWLFSARHDLAASDATLGRVCRDEWHSLPGWALATPWSKWSPWVDGFETRALFPQIRMRFAPRAIYRCGAAGGIR